MEASLLSTTLFPLLLSAFVIFTLLKQKLWSKHTKPCTNSKLPPGPWKLPLIGSMLHLIGDLPHRRISKLAQTYGPLMHLKLGEINLIVISSPEIASEILKTHDIIFASRPPLLIGEIIFYKHSDIIFAPYGKYWWKLRRIVAMNMLGEKRSKSFRFIAEDEVNNFIDNIRTATAAGLGPVNLTTMLFSLSSKTLARVVFGMDCVQQDEFLKAINEIRKLGSGFDLVDIFPSSALIEKVSSLRRRLESTHRYVDGILNEIIEERQANQILLENDDEEMDGDIVDVLLRIQKNGDLELPLTMDNVKGIILDLFIAGSETSSSFLNWAMAELVRNPEIMQKAQFEVRNAFKGKTRLEESNINELEYLDCVIKEAFRLHPATPLLLPRMSTETVKLLGYTIPVGSRVIVNIGSIMRDPKYWDDPEIFRPERFEGSSLDVKGTSFNYLPFGGGRRICPGMTFAMANVKQWLAQLLLHFDFDLPHGMKPKDLDMEELSGSTVTKKNALCVLATPHM